MNKPNMLGELLPLFVRNNTQENVMLLAFALLPQRTKPLKSGEFSFVIQEMKKKKAKYIVGEIQRFPHPHSFPHRISES